MEAKREAQRRSDGNSRRRLIAVAAAAVLGLGVGLAIPTAALSQDAGANVLSQNLQLPDPVQTLAEAQAAAPYKILIPATLPSGANLFLVDWTQSPDDDIPIVTSVSIRWSLPDGSWVSVWEDNDPSLPADKDPAESSAETTAVDLSGQTWQEQPTAFGTNELGAKLPDGLTVAVDGQVPEATLRATASSLAAASTAT